MNTIPSTQPDETYRHFNLAIYARVYDVQQMADLDWLKSRFEVMQHYIKVGKVYLETLRDMVVAEETTLDQARNYLTSRGVQVSGGITLTVNERNNYETYCYTDPEHRQKLKEVVAFTAHLFDEVILDDFFFHQLQVHFLYRSERGTELDRFSVGADDGGGIRTCARTGTGR